jgi:hypothetical protein
VQFIYHGDTKFWEGGDDAYTINQDPTELAAHIVNGSLGEFVHPRDRTGGFLNTIKAGSTICENLASITDNMLSSCSDDGMQEDVFSQFVDGVCARNATDQFHKVKGSCTVTEQGDTQVVKGASPQLPNAIFAFVGSVCFVPWLVVQDTFDLNLRTTRHPLPGWLSSTVTLSTTMKALKLVPLATLFVFVLLSVSSKTVKLGHASVCFWSPAAGHKLAYMSCLGTDESTKTKSKKYLHPYDTDWATTNNIPQAYTAASYNKEDRSIKGICSNLQNELEKLFVSHTICVTYAFWAYAKLLTLADEQVEQVAGDDKSYYLHVHSVFRQVLLDKVGVILDKLTPSFVQHPNSLTGLCVFQETSDRTDRSSTSTVTGRFGTVRNLCGTVKEGPFRLSIQFSAYVDAGRKTSQEVKVQLKDNIYFIGDNTEGGNGKRNEQ